MTSVVTSIASILFGFCLLLVGAGLLNTLLGVRAGLENFSDAVTGLIMSGYFLGFVVGTYYCPGLIRRVGHIRAYAALAALGAAVAFLHVLLVEPNTWLALRILTGISLVGLYMIIESWINAIAPDEYRSRLFATYMMATLVAMGIGPYLIIVDGGKTAVTFGIAAMLFSLGLLPVVLTKVPEPRSIQVPKLNLKTLFRVAPTGIVGATAAGLANSAFFGMGAVFAHKLNFDEQGIALFMSLLVLGGTCLQWPIGHLSDNRDRRKVIAAICLLAAIIAFAAFIVAERSQEMLFVLVFIYGGMAFTVYPLSVAHVNDHIESDDFLDAARSILLMYGIGATLGPLLAGFLMQLTGPKSLLILMSGVYLITAVYIMYLQRVEVVIPADDQTSFTPMVRTSQAALNLHPEVNEEIDQKTVE